MDKKIDDFIKKLEEAKNLENCFNPYQHKEQRENLKLYLQYMITQKPNIILVGEAPGKNGCRLTGIPFTSEDIIINGIPELNGIFGEEQGFCKAKNSEESHKEPTATIVWNILKELQIVPVPAMWNAFPFHPHEKNDPDSNRTPTQKEIEYGKSFLEDFITMFNPNNPQIIAVGKKAEGALKKCNIDAEEIRHPSYGGQEEFESRLKDIIQNMK